MKLIRAAFGSLNTNIISNRCRSTYSIRNFSVSNSGSGTEYNNSNSPESDEAFEQRLFGGGLTRNNQDTEFYQKLDKVKNTHGRQGLGFGSNSGGKLGDSSFMDGFEQRLFGGGFTRNNQDTEFYEKLDKVKNGHGRQGLGLGFGTDSSFMDGFDESLSSLSDGLNGKLKKAARYFEYDPEEIHGEEYVYRPDRNFRRGDTYQLKDLDLTKPAVNTPQKQNEFETTTEEVLRKADFRNVRFLANFLTEAGIIIKRSQTKISAKAQRKVAREIKTARAFGLMPFTTMGEYPFRFGRNRREYYSEDEDDTFSRRQFGRNFVEPEPEVEADPVEPDFVEPEPIIP